MNFRQSDSGMPRVGVLCSHSRQEINGISRYQWMIVDIIERQGVEFEFFNLYGTESAGRNKFLQAIWIAWRFIRLPLNINHSSIDVFWGPAHRLPFGISKKIPCVLTIHDLVWKKAGATMPAYRRLLESVIMPLSLKRADIVVAVSKSTANDVLELIPECKNKVHVIPLAAFTESFADLDSLGSTSLVPEKPYVLFVGTLEPRKNLGRLLEAYKKLPQELISEYQLIIVGGKGWGNLRVADQVENLGLSGSVSLLGRVTDAELRSLYKNAYCLAMPSLYEGFGLPILEAQSFGVPVITSRSSSMPEVAADGAIYVDPYDVMSISNSLHYLLADRSARDDLSRRSLINSQRFSCAQSAKLTLDVFIEAYERGLKR